MAEVVIDKVDEIETLSKPMNAQDFFNNYVSKRRPVKFSFVFDELQEAIDKWKDDKYLLSKAGNETISAEVRSSKDEKFGVSTKKKMKFCDFLKELKSEKHYLSVQEIELNELGHPHKLWTLPLTDDLMKDIPMKPEILCNLALHQINVWMGHSVKGSSSKLHHDFHDNLYIVIRGSKTFQIFPPKCAYSLYLNGADRIHKIFDNGLIAYSEYFREDGADKMIVDEWKCDKNENEHVIDADFDIDNALEQALNEKFEQMENEQIESDEDNCSDVEEPPSKKRKFAKNEATDPQSFSRIDLGQDKDDLIKMYPKYANVHKLKQTVTIKEGQMLWLPCGWFHDVTSVSNNELKSHFALNYWLHPSIKNGTFKQPYCDNFWHEYNKEMFHL